MNWYELKSKCVTRVAREIARPRVPKDAGWEVWPMMVEEARDEAIEKIKAMNGIELLDLISDVMGTETNA